MDNRRAVGQIQDRSCDSLLESQNFSAFPDQVLHLDISIAKQTTARIT